MGPDTSRGFLSTKWRNGVHSAGTTVSSSSSYAWGAEAGSFSTAESPARHAERMWGPKRPHNGVPCATTADCHVGVCNPSSHACMAGPQDSAKRLLECGLSRMDTRMRATIAAEYSIDAGASVVATAESLLPHVTHEGCFGRGASSHAVSQRCVGWLQAHNQPHWA